MAGKPVRKRWLMKCRSTSTGRKCDGYQTEAPSPPAKSSPSVISSPTSVVSTYATRPEARSFQFFIEKTLVNFQTFFEDDLWNRRVLQVAQSTDCIRHAIVALAYYHQLYLTHEQWRSLDSVSALKHYNLAIRELLNPSPDTSSQGHILVLSCLIFICIELLHGKTDSAISLFRYGCRMIQQFRRTFSVSRGHGSHTKSDVEATFNLADACFRRIAVQLLMLMGDVDAGLWSSYYKTFSNTLPPPNTSFSSLSDAREAILELLVEQASPGLKGKPIYETISHASKVEQWGQSFDNLLTELGNSGKSFSAGDKRAIALLQLHRKYLEINVAKYLHGQGDPCFWDRFTAEFDEIVNYAATAAGLDKNYTQRNWANDSPSEAYFHVDLGYTSVLVSVIARCRDPSVRRRAIAVMLAELSSFGEVFINNEKWLYTVEIAIGNPPQKTLVQVDTGSSDLWVNANCSSAPAEFGQQELCEEVPRFDHRLSNSSKGPLGSKLLGYGSGDELNGALVDIYQDTVTIGDIKVRNQMFGVASNSRGLPIGIMGLGPGFNGSFAVNESHPLLLDSMAIQGAITSRVYSLALGTADDKQGSLIFGGLDKGRFFGTLYKTPIVKSRDGGSRLTINISSIGADGGNGSTKAYPLKDTNFHLDSGHTFSKLNKELAEQIFRDVGAELDRELGFYMVDCKLRDHAGGLVLNFGENTIITVPLRELIYTAQGLCAVGVEPVEEGKQQILGDSFLRAAYVVFDFDNKNVHIAQAANCTSEIVAIGAGSDAVPSVTSNCQAPGFGEFKMGAKS
ncbi:hypothetical protein HZS61_013961 [Fusarium oxysporum f. sp. conglutinans]|uniref:Peptidase A1 domain-containing protein n=1 Tax=Fusarium oxysporum f. sp. conglutinans TaxID=100902 RepID=A0A8H6GQ68_FUSOX|nr:hypothetical protein HZS61_013961 [Fusarium oxysporum f. sp. conglutinans]